MFLKLIFLYIPATFVAHYGILGLLRLDFQWKDLLAYSVILGTMTIIVRDLLNLSGFHVLFLSACSIVMLMLCFKLSVMKAVTVRALLLMILTIGEAPTTKFVFHLTGISVDDVLTSVCYHIILGWLGHIVPIILAVYVATRKLIVSRERGSVFGQKA